MKKIIIINKIVFFLIFKYCLFFNLENKSTLKGNNERLVCSNEILIDSMLLTFIDCKINLLGVVGVGNEIRRWFSF